MRIPPPNPLTTVSVWIAAIFMGLREGADKAGVFPGLVAAMSGAWSYLPIGVLALAALIYVVRMFLPERPHPNAITFVGDGKAVAKRRAPELALTRQGERPTMALHNALGTILLSRWSREHDATPESCERELRDKLAAHDLTAFGRLTPDSVIRPIAAARWLRLKIDTEGSSAINVDTGAADLCDLQFDREYVLSLWPTGSERI